MRASRYGHTQILMYNIWVKVAWTAHAIGIEARALYNVGQAKGMAFWSPNINIFRDPRWGRGQETPREDPLVTGKYSVSYVRGIQGDSFEGGNISVLQTSACCKHFIAYDLDRWNNITRYTFDANVTVQDMVDTYEPPFQKCVQEGRANGIMYVTSDCDAVSIIYDEQRYVQSPEDAVADVLKAGIPPGISSRSRPERHCPVTKLCQPSPLAENSNQLAHCHRPQRRCPSNASRKLRSALLVKLVSPLQALQSYVNNTHYLQGCDSVACTSSSLREAVDLAKSVDYVVLIMGLDQTQEREEQDRDDLGLPGMQESLVSRGVDGDGERVLYISWLLERRCNKLVLFSKVKLVKLQLKPLE
ncbi:hypothetical protein Scep_018595 [Stephania cephalantha]|uniref:Glycoside hydrolase family 3 N-terminal domain-containing protein n=1 Tax=Stephania cephalantha TaxID=152367 RepID=A0AAP0IA61_9MAGN